MLDVEMEKEKETKIDEFVDHHDVHSFKNLVSDSVKKAEFSVPFCNEHTANF